MDDRTRRSERLDETSMADVVDSAVRRIATSIAIVGVAIALAIYARPGPPHFEAFATPTGFIRIDTRSGTVIGCETGRCMTLLRRGQALADNPNRHPRKASGNPANKALPAPATTPAPAAPQPQAPATNPAPASEER